MIFSIPPGNGIRFVLSPILNLFGSSPTADNLEAQQATQQASSQPVSSPVSFDGTSEPDSAPDADDSADNSANNQPRNMRESFAAFEWQLVKRWDSIPLRGMEAYMENDPDDIEQRAQEKGQEKALAEQILREQQIQQVQDQLMSNRRDPGADSSSS